MNMSLWASAEKPGIESKQESSKIISDAKRLYKHAKFLNEIAGASN